MRLQISPMGVSCASASCYSKQPANHALPLRSPPTLPQAGTGLIALGVVIVNLEKLQRSKGAAQPVPESSAAGSEAGLPQHRYQLLGHPAAAAAQAGGGGGWWRRLWGGAALTQSAQQQQQQQLEEQEWLPDYRGMLKAKHSGKNLEVHLELGAATHAEQRSIGGSGSTVAGA